MSEFQLDDATLREGLKKWVSTREETIQKLETLATFLDDLNKKCNVAKLSGGSVAVASGVVGLLSLFAIPFTGGLSLFGTVICAGTGAAGGGTLLITDVIKRIKEDSYVQEAESALEIDKKETQKFHDTIQLDRSVGLIKAGKRIAGCTKAVAFVGRVSTYIAKNVLVRGGSAAINTLRAVSSLAKAAKFAGPILSVAFLPIDIADLVTTVIDTHKGSLSDAAIDIRKIIEELQKELDLFKNDEDYTSFVQ